MNLVALTAIGIMVLSRQMQGRSPAGFGAWLLALYSMTVPYGSALRTGMPEPLESVSSALGVVTIAGLGYEIMATRRLRMPQVLHVVLWVLLGGALLASALRAVDGAVALREAIVLTGLLVLYVLAATNVISPAELLLIQRATSLGGGVLGSLAMIQVATGTLPAGRSGVPRFEVPWDGGDPNITAASLLLPLAVSGFLHRSSVKVQDRVVAATSMALTFTAILLTNSRAGMLAGAVIVLHHVLVERRFKLALALAAAAAVPLSFIWSTASQQVVRTSSTGRFELWAVGVEQCQTWCGAGAGLGSFPVLHRQGVLSGSGPVPTKLNFEAHNIFLQVAVESGIIALILLLAACLLTLRELVRSPDPFAPAYALALSGLLFTNFFLSNLSFKYFWLVLMHAAWISAPGLSSGDRDRQLVAP